jgi:hypothetical protein
MKIKMLTSMSGPTTQRNRGDEIDVSAAEGGRLIKAGFAESVRNMPREKATGRAPRETTTAEPSSEGDEPPATEETADPAASHPDGQSDAAQAGDGSGE